MSWFVQRAKLARHAVLLTLVSSTAAAVPGDTATHPPDAVIDAWVADERIVGVVALVAKDGNLIYQRAAGYADREQRIPVTRSTIFRLSSMTKTIVSATALALVDRGMLSLDDPVHKWLPEFRPRLPDGRQPSITVRQLMTHTSGLSYDFFQPEDSPYRLGRVSTGLDQPGLSLEENLKRLTAVPLTAEPAAQWQYSISTDVLGAVIERVANLTLPEAIEQYVTAPLGMRDTAFVVTDKSRFAVPYATLFIIPGTFLPMNTSETNKSVVRAFVDAVNERDWQTLDLLVSPHFVRHSEAARPDSVRDRQQLKAFLIKEFEAFPDGRETVEDLVAEGDRVAARKQFTGTQCGPLGNYPPSGRRLEASYLAIYRLEDGRIAEAWAEWDNLSGLEQLGHI